jgi:hypothetical protein
VAFLLKQMFKRKISLPVRIPLYAALALSLVAIFAAQSGCGGGGSAASQSSPSPSPSPNPAPQVTATPSMRPVGGIMSTGFPSVAITDSTAGATIYYTTDGSTPTTSSPVFSTAFTVTTPTTVQALATASGYSQSAVATASYKFQTPSGTFTISVTPTAVPTNSSKPLQLNPIQLTLTVK